jgi:hypothetical protein
MTDLPAVIGLQEANGLEMGRILQSNHAYTDICHLIASEMRKNLVKYMIENDLTVGFMIDESATISEKDALVICLRCRLPEYTDTSSFFFDLIELDNTRAASIVEMCPSSNGFEDEFRLRNWISFVCDRTSNVLGKHAGVVRHLVEKYLNLIVWLCSNHRFEIALNDVVREMSAVCQKSFNCAESFCISESNNSHFKLNG